MLGARIAVLRRQAGFSQAELAQKLRISPSAVGMYEQGRREPSGELLVAMAKVFGVSTDYLLTGAPRAARERQVAEDVLVRSVSSLEKRVKGRKDPFSRQELAVLFAALLMDT